MRTDLISRLAACMLAVLFLSNDLIATTRLMITGVPITYSSSDTTPIVPIQSQKLEIPSDIEVLAGSGHAYLGSHPNDPVNSPKDDVFEIDLDLEGTTYEYAWLKYEVHGLENPEDLPKTINGKTTYGQTDLSLAPDWKEARVRIERDDLKNGRNTIRFSLPEGMLFPVEVKNVSIELKEENPALSPVQPAVIRRPASSVDFEVLSEGADLVGYKVSQGEAASIPSHIVNVTRQSYAYHLDGSNHEGYHVAIGVDASSVHSQSEMNQVQVFFFDDLSGEWKRAHVIKVDHARLRVEAMVPGETDYFAGLIQSPEMPEAGAFVPTNISDIEPASPATGMRMMQAPSANRTGSASITYPLWIPQGRNGMTPPVAASYSSDQGTGWMGLGWNISVSMISVDTKWGVPEYDADVESESYVLDGEALFMEGNKRANRPTLDGSGDVVPLARSESGTVRFFPRVMASYSEIERKGLTPSNYYWIVTDASQTKRYYGSIDGTAQDTNSVLKTGSGKVAQWYLKRVEDKWGNTIDYEYELFEEGTTSNMKSGGVNRVIKKITYTGFNGTSYQQGKYSVEFHTSDTRGDGRVSMNLGVKHVDDRRLDSISVRYNTDVLVRYKMTYDRGSGTFFKTVLTALREYRSGQLFYEHTFDYYEDPIDYEDPVILDATNPYPWLKTSSDISFFEPIREGLVRLLAPSSINTSITGGFSVGGSIGGGLTADVGQNKNGTFSIGIGFDQHWTSATRTMRDVNGDGLADLLFEDHEGNFVYSPVRYENGQLTVGGRRQFGAGGVQRSSDFSFRTNIDYRSTLGYYVGFNWNTSTSKVKRSLTDYNADGIPDLLVYDGTATPAVQFGLLDPKGDLSFSQSSENTLNPVIKGIDFDIDDQDDRIKEFQIVRVWKAPAGGTINIKGTAKVRTGLMGAGAIAIQQNSSFITSGFESITHNSSHTSDYTFGVSKGDLILFRTISEDDGQEDFVEWNPIISYTSGTHTDGNGTPWSGSTAADGFLLSGREGVSVKGDHEFKVDLNLSVTGTLTDNVYVVMQPYIDGVPQAPITDVLPIGGPYTTSNLNGYGFVGGYDSFDSYSGYDAADNVSFKFSLWSTSNVDWDAIEFRPVVKFDEEDCRVADEQYPLVDYETYNEIVVMDGDRYRPSNPSTYYEVVPQVTINTSDIDACFDYSTEDEEGIVYMTVKSGGNFLSRVAVRLIRDYSTPANNTIQVHPMTASTGVIDKTTSLSFAGYQGDPDVKFLGSQIVSDMLFVEFHGTGPAARQLAEYIDQHLFRIRFLSTGSNQTVGGTTPSKNIYYRGVNEFNTHYLSWGRFAWSPGAPELVEAAIDTSELHSVVFEQIENGTIDLTDSTDIFDNRNTLNPLNHTFFQMNATRGERDYGLRSYHRALGSGEDLDRYSVFGTYMGEYQKLNGISSGYLGEEESDSEELATEPGINPSYTARGALSYSRSGTLGITGGYSAVTVATHFAQKDLFYSRSKRLFLDMNGDGYPDVLNENDDEVTLYPTNRFGSHTDGTTGHGLNDYLNKGTSFGVAVSGGVGIESGAYLNVDERFEIISKESSIPLSGSVNLGRNRTRTSFIDINGDGLPDEYYDDVELWGSASPTFVLNGGGVMQGSSFDAHDKINGSSFQVSASGAFSTVTTSVSMVRYILNKWFGNGPLSTDSKSWEVGGAVNYAVNQSERVYLDLTGDGLVDYLEYDTDFFDDEVKIYINEGYEFAYYGEISTDPIDEEINKNTGLGFTGKITGTGSFTPFGLKIKASLTGNGDVSVNRLQNSFMDMNGDGAPDYVEHSGQSDLEVYFAIFGRNGKLKTVHNPLGGSFTISYESEGQKSGYYEPQVKTHLSDATGEKMIWDMPQGKLVMSEVSVNDSLDVVAGSTDLDGADEMTMRFAYDGGIYSRREREFLGFTRVATITESHIEEETNEEYLKDYCDYDDIETPRNVSGLYTSPEQAGNGGITMVDTLGRYNVSVLEYSKPVSLDKDELFAYSYLSRLPETQYELHVHEWKDSVQVMGAGDPLVFLRWDKWNFTHIELISESNPDYEIRLVDTDSQSEFFGQVARDGEEWDVVDNLNELGETTTIFPAVTQVKKVNFPVVEDRDHYNASKSTMAYDGYFNVIRVEDAGTGVASTPDTVVVDTMYYTHYVYEAQTNACSSLVSLDTVYNDGVIYGILVPWASAGNFEDAVVFGMFAPSACLPDTIPTEYLCGEGVSTFSTTHRGTKTDTIYIKEINYNAVYSGNIIAVMQYFPPSGSTSDQTNVLKVHKIYQGSTVSANLKRWSEVLELEDNLAPGKIAQYLSTSGSPPSGETAESLIRYTDYGLVDSVVGPANLNGQRAFRMFDYDTDVYQFVTQVINEHSDTACSTYDPGYQHMLQNVDPNGHPMRYTYDEFQRPEYIWAPREIYNNANGPTIRFEYFPGGKNPAQPGGDVPVAFTHHNTGNRGIQVTYAPGSDYCGSPVNVSGFTTTMSKPVTTATLTDRMSQPVQIQTVVDWDDPGTSPHTMANNYRVSGIAERNKFGLGIRQRNDTLVSSLTLGYLASLETSIIGESEFDYVSRPVKQTGLWSKTGGSGDEIAFLEQNTTYLWDTYSSNDYFTARTNAAGVSETYTMTDSRGQTVASKVKDLIGSLPDAITHFTYDPLGQVTQTKNPIDEITYFKYDNFGRVVREIHPDRDTTWTDYDLSGNIETIQTAATKPDYLSFDYNYNRLIKKTLPSGSIASDLYDVRYTYGTKGDGKNGAGRVVQVVQGDSTEPFKTEYYKYDELGQRSYEKKTIAVPKYGVRNFITQSFYDSFGRTLQLIYPDGEKVNYNYTDLGSLSSVSTYKGGVTSWIINAISYDGYDNMVFMEYGNGTETEYSYHNYTRMLMESDVDAEVSSSLISVLDRDYTYNNRGMISEVTRNVHSSVMGGYNSSHTFSYSYDALNRLKVADFQFNTAHPLTGYSVDMEYDEAGGITSKKSTSIVNPMMANRLDYDLTYTHSSSHPHQIQTVDVDGVYDLSYQYNSSGSVEQIDSVNSGTYAVKKFRWTEDQWLMADSVNSEIHHYVYDHTGERMMKSSFLFTTTWVNGQPVDITSEVDPYTLYVNPYFVQSNFSNGVQQTKHYYMGMQRVASDISLLEEFEDPNPSAKTSSQGVNGRMDENAETDESSAPFTDPVIRQLASVLESFGMKKGEDFTMEELKHRSSLQEQFPEYVNEPSLNLAFTGDFGGDFGECCFEGLRFWYHPDYLGSVDMITDPDGEVHQYFMYTPWGENMYTYTSTNHAFDSPYRFNGKELDQETGLHYYGARYYQNRISSWLSVDPKAMEGHNISMTPYHFSSNNPVMRVDPDGMNDGWIEGENGNVTYDPNVHSQQDLIDRGMDGTYMFEEGNVGFYDDNGDFQGSYQLNSNGSVSSDGQVVAESGFEELRVEGLSIYGSTQASQNASDHSDLNLYGPTLIAAGQPIRSLKPIGALGSKPGSSLASYVLSKSLPWKSPVRFMGTRVIGRSVGRFVPVVGWGLLLYDCIDQTYIHPDPAIQGPMDIQGDIRNGELSPQQMIKKYSCFVEGTKIQMANGSEKNIEEITVGDEILSVDVETMTIKPDTVIDVPNVMQKYSEIKAVFSNGITNSFSPAHPFWVVGKGWAVFDISEAQEELDFDVVSMEQGDTVLYLENGNLIQVVIAEIYPTGNEVYMYNVEFVKNNHSFFANGILVHNKRIY